MECFAYEEALIGPAIRARKLLEYPPRTFPCRVRLPISPRLIYRQPSFANSQPTVDLPMPCFPTRKSTRLGGLRLLLTVTRAHLGHGSPTLTSAFLNNPVLRERGNLRTSMAWLASSDMNPSMFNPSCLWSTMVKTVIGLSLHPKIHDRPNLAGVHPLLLKPRTTFHSQS